MPSFTFELTGLTPLLMHADNIEAGDELEKYRKDPANKKSGKAGDDRSPAWTYQGYMYNDGTHITIPSDNLMPAIRKAAAEITLKKQKTFKALSQSGMMVEQEFMEFRANGKQIKVDDLPGRDLPFSEHVAACQKLGFRLFMKRVAIGPSKHIRVRPRFDSWSVKGADARHGFGDHEGSSRPDAHDRGASGRSLRLAAGVQDARSVLAVLSHTEVSPGGACPGAALQGKAWWGEDADGVGGCRSELAWASQAVPLWGRVCACLGLVGQGVGADGSGGYAIQSGLACCASVSFGWLG